MHGPLIGNASDIECHADEQVLPSPTSAVSPRPRWKIAIISRRPSNTTNLPLDIFKNSPSQYQQPSTLMSGYRRGTVQLTRLILSALAAFGLLVWVYQGHDWTSNQPLTHTIKSSKGSRIAPSSFESKPVGNSPASVITTPTVGLKSVNSQDDSDIDRHALEAFTASPEIKSKIWSRIGKISSLYYDRFTSISQAYEKALLSHIDHDQRFGYSHFVLRRGIVEGLWTKHALILHYLVKELAKSPAERLEWLFWHDADVVIVNNQMPLEAFLPPEPRWSHINFIVSNDLGGLNDGVFFLRVCEWSVHFFAAGLSYPFYKPDVYLRYDEQTALEFLIQEEKWANNTMHVPQRWFNAYHHFGRDDDIPPEWNWTNGYQEPGDLLVHLPGTADARSQLINEWLDKVRYEHEKYCLPLGKTTYPEDIKTFWESEAVMEAERQAVFWRRYSLLQEVGLREDDETRAEIQDAKARMNGTSTDDEIEKVAKHIKEERKHGKIVALREAEAALLRRK